MKRLTVTPHKIVLCALVRVYGERSDLNSESRNNLLLLLLRQTSVRMQFELHLRRAES